MLNPRADEPLLDLREHATRFSSYPRYTWVNGLQACGTGLQKPEVDSKCFGASITAVAKSILTLNCSTKPTADAGPG